MSSLACLDRVHSPGGASTSHQVVGQAQFSRQGRAPRATAKAHRLSPQRDVRASGILDSYRRERGIAVADTGPAVPADSKARKALLSHENTSIAYVPSGKLLCKSLPGRIVTAVSVRIWRVRSGTCLLSCDTSLKPSTSIYTWCKNCILRTAAAGGVSFDSCLQENLDEDGDDGVCTAECVREVFTGAL